MIFRSENRVAVDAVLGSSGYLCSIYVMSGPRFDPCSPIPVLDQKRVYDL